MNFEFLVYFIRRKYNISVGTMKIFRLYLPVNVFLFIGMCLFFVVVFAAFIPGLSQEFKHKLGAGNKKKSTTFQTINRRKVPARCETWISELIFI